MNSPWNRLRELPLKIEGYGLRANELQTGSGFVRLTTEVELEGAGHTGHGEDVGWHAELQKDFRARGAQLDLKGEFSLGGFCALLESLELSPDQPAKADWRHYRRWAFESAALDLALRQADLGLEAALGRAPSPLYFALSLGPRDMSDVQERLAIHPDARLKLDATPIWSAEFCAQLAQTKAVDVVDFKGAYVGTPVDVAADLGLYRRVLDAMPDVIVEDPHNDGEVLAFLRERAAQVAWDAPIHSLSDLHAMPFEATSLNIKPSRFGALEGLLAAYEYCERENLPMYGGGQFELGVGRLQIQRLAGIFHAQASNDVAPRGYHQLESDEPRPASPLPANPGEPGF